MSLKFCEGFVINEDDFTTGWKAWSLSVRSKIRRYDAALRYRYTRIHT